MNGVRRLERSERGWPVVDISQLGEALVRLTSSDGEEGGKLTPECQSPSAPSCGTPGCQSYSPHARGCTCRRAASSGLRSRPPGPAYAGAAPQARPSRRRGPRTGPRRWWTRSGSGVGRSRRACRRWRGRRRRGGWSGVLRGCGRRLPTCVGVVSHTRPRCSFFFSLVDKSTQVPGAWSGRIPLRVGRQTGEGDARDDGAALLTWQSAPRASRRGC